MNFKKYFFLFIIFGIFVLILLLPRISSAIITGLGCGRDSTVKYETECGDEKTIGSCSGGHCCSEHKVCEETCDDEGNCTESCHNVCDDRCWKCSCSGSWDEYGSACADSSSCSCGTDEECCDKDILWRYCYSQQGEDDCHMGSCENEECCVKCDPSETCEECGSWQKPFRNGCGGDCTKWGATKPECKCCGECIEAPKNLQEYQDPNSSRVADSPAKLPVKLDWDDVPGWWTGGWGGAGSNIQEYADCQKGFIDFCWEEAKALNPDWNCQGELTRPYLDCLRSWTASSCEILLQDEECEESCPAIEGEDECYEPGEFVQSYVINISGGEMRLCDGSTSNDYTEALDASEFFAPCPCFFKSGESYSWKVKACCGIDGTGECSDWSTSKSFNTSLAPEPILPRDPDWEGGGRAEPDWTTSTHEGYPVELGWCEVEEAVSYIIQAYERGAKYCPEILCPFCPNCPMLFQKEGLAVPQGSHSIYFDLDSFTKETLYDWEIATCFNEYGESCNDFSQRWKFYGYIELSQVELVSPEDGGCANLSSQLEWKHAGGAHSYRYNINPVPSLQNVLATSSFSFKDIWNYLELDVTYTWQVKACWDENGIECEGNSWSDIWEFTTTGAPPTDLKVAKTDPSTGDALIPIELDWTDVPCAASYRYELAGGGTTTEGLLLGSSELSIGYDSGHPKQNAPYSWRIQTCADIEGNICGGWASSSFMTFELSAPGNPQPSDGGEFYTYESYLKWGPVLGGAFYQYEIVGKIGPTIMDSNSAFIDTAALELGTYTWTVRACIDENCEEAGPVSTWTFELVEGEAPAGAGGIVPCGKYTDNPNTPWNERDHCGIQHVFIMIFSIIDFLLWKVLPIALVLLALASGVIFYFSGQLGITHPPTQVKSLWKAAGIGLGVIFLAWTGISLILGLFNYQVGIFGQWWKIEF